MMTMVSSSGSKCLVAKNEDSWLWHRRLSHVHFDLLNKIVSKDLVADYLKYNFKRTYYVMLVKRGSKLECLLNLKRLFLLQDI